MKKALAIILALVLVLGLTACGSSGSSGGGKTEETADTVKLGVCLIQSGDFAFALDYQKPAIDMVINMYNEAGGINGKKIELVSYDEEGDATKAVTGYNSVMDQGVVAIIGSVTTAPTIAVVAESFADNTPMITASATAIPVTFNEETNQVYTNMFRSCFIDSFQGVTMARFAKNVLAADTAAVLYDNGDTYSTGVYDYFVNECAAQGIEVATT